MEEGRSTLPSAYRRIRRLRSYRGIARWSRSQRRTSDVYSGSAEYVEGSKYTYIVLRDHLPWSDTFTSDWPLTLVSDGSRSLLSDDTIFYERKKEVLLKLSISKLFIGRNKSFIFTFLSYLFPNKFLWLKLFVNILLPYVSELL